MKLLVTGATGFIGRHLTKRLITEGHEVSILVRANSNVGELENLLAKNQIHIYDGSDASLLNALSLSNPNIVFHLASLFITHHKQEELPLLIESNIKFPAQLLECMSHLGFKNFINAGTSWQHYNNELFNPVNLYAATKQAFEVLLKYYTEACNFKVITLCLFDTYGPGDNRNKIFSLLRKSVQNNVKLMMSPGEQLVNLVYIDDILEAFINAMSHLPNTDKSDRFAVSSSKQISLREIVAVYSEAVGKKVPVVWGGQPYRFREILVPWNNYEPVPNWNPKVNLFEGIIKMEKDKNINGLLSKN